MRSSLLGKTHLFTNSRKSSWGAYSKRAQTASKYADQSRKITNEHSSCRYEKEFDSVQDVFELQRNLNNAFAYDLVPSPSVITAALRAARRVNDFPTAVRIFEGMLYNLLNMLRKVGLTQHTAIKAKVENKGQYDEYIHELNGIREELGINLKETMYPELA